MIRKCGLIFLAGLLLFVLMVFGLPARVFSNSEPPLTHVFVSPAASDAKTCELHTIAISIEDVEDLTGYDLLIHFDPSVVEVTDVVNGNFLDTPEEKIFYPPANKIDNVDGFIRFGMVQQGVTLDPDVEPQSGDGDLIFITIQPLIPYETTDFIIDASSELTDWPDAFPIDFRITDGEVYTVNCLPAADDQIVFTTMHTPVGITLTGSDQDNDPLQYNIVRPPGTGKLAGTPPNLVYTPRRCFFGMETFTFTVFDGYDTSLRATVTIVVKQDKHCYYFALIGK